MTPKSVDSDSPYDRPDAQLLEDLSRRATFGDLSVTVMHDILNPLMLVLGHAHVMKTMVDDGHPAADSIEIIRSAAIQIERLVQSVHSLGEPSEDTSPGTQVDAVVGQTLRFLDGGLKLEGVDVRVICSPNLPCVRIQWNDLMLVLLNVFSNAREAMSSSGHRVLTLRIQGADGEVVLKVSDTGTGISTQDREHIFEPFFTAEDRSRSGLGLFVARRLLARSGGSILLDPNDADTSFIIHLPTL